MSVEVIRVAELPIEDWANGLGRTRLVVDRPGLRVSLADIHDAATFSLFPGSRRLLVVVGPVGIELDLGVHRHHMLPGDSIRFDGGAEVRVNATAALTTVLNVIHDDRWTSENISRSVEDVDTLPLVSALTRHEDQGEDALVAFSSRVIAISNPKTTSAGAGVGIVAARWRSLRPDPAMSVSDGASADSE